MTVANHNEDPHNTPAPRVNHKAADVFICDRQLPLVLVRAVSLFDVPLVIYAHQRFREAPLLLIIEACKERLSGISKFLLIGGALAHIISFPVHAVDDIDRAFLLRAIRSGRIFSIRPAFADVAHRTLESGPVLLLVWREAQVSPDTRRLGIDLI
jgi:hypothetical protein